MSNPGLPTAAAERVVTTRPGLPSARPSPADIARRRAETRDAYVFLAPYLVLFTVFVILPFIFGIWISLHDYDYSLPDKPFVGLDNYTGLIDGSSAYADAFWLSMRA